MVSKVAVKFLNSQMANCLWNDSEGNNKYHLANWESVAMCKEFGGLGIPNLRDLNTCLLTSWLKRYNNDKNKLWKELIDFKYDLVVRIFSRLKLVVPLIFFIGFLWAAHAAKMGFMWQIVDGKTIHFWEDNWLGASSLAIQYFKLYKLLNEQNKTVAELWDGSNVKCTFRRTFDDTLENMWFKRPKTVTRGGCNRTVQIIRAQVQKQVPKRSNFQT
jgi:hypothetical protein